MESETLNREKSVREKLVFVYNANSGFRNGILDSLHKIVRPNTYDCKLCDVTYGFFSEKKVWKDFRKRVSGEWEFLHKDEFQKQYASKFGYAFRFPIVLVVSQDGFEVLITKKQLDAIKSPEELIRLIRSRIGL